MTAATTPMLLARLRVELRGAVQGVGFRPFVYRLAAELSLTGWVSNDSRGVLLEVEGQQEGLTSFLERLPDEKPAHALIQSLQAHWLEPHGYTQFEIRHSNAQGSKTVLMLPDLATCPACLGDVLNPANRRAGYAFTNCTNCGPRFSILQALPYDRPNTTMHGFAMCAACASEYRSPLDRRFHAQPNACPECGPHLAWWPSAAGALVLPGADPDAAAIQQAAEALRAGQIVALKGLGGFHLLVDANTPAAVARLRERKHRPAKPLALLVRNLEQAHTLVDISPEAAALLTSAQAPILLLPRLPHAPIAANVAPGNSSLGVMLPATPLHHLLMHAVGRPLVATSGNLSDEPICIDEQEAAARLGSIADSFLVHNRPIERHVDDSLLWLVNGAPQLLRRARGYAPLPVGLARPVPTLLAVGAHLKNTIALSMQRQAFISQHIGDLETPQALAAFERVIADFLHLYEAQPVAVAHDMHPDYRSTQWARQWAEARNAALANQHIALIPVQHHHAHLAACLAEHGAGEGLALGIVWDGTGYGTDGTIWGGEVLLGNAASVRRVAHLWPFRLPGGTAAVREPRRVALALLWETFGAAALEYDLPVVQAISPQERNLFGQMLTRAINAPLTTSAGRLFDGIAALIGLYERVSFEGQAAQALEFCADPLEQGAYPLPLTRSPGQPEAPALLDWRPMVAAIVQDMRRGVDRSTIAARFHNALVGAMLDITQQMGVPQVALTGGCFQNRLLTERAAQRLSALRYTVLLHQQVPPNDGGISLGQLAVAAHQVQGE